LRFDGPDVDVEVPWDSLAAIPHGDDFVPLP